MEQPKTTNVPDGIYFRAYGNYRPKPYPVWRYHKIFEPVVVHDTREDEEKKALGYEPLWAPISANTSPLNWFWDLEDLSSKQLRVYAREEFEIEFPPGTSREQLFKLILKLSKFAPQNQGRLILMAHTIKMNYDETLEEIKRMAYGGNGCVTEVEKKEVYL